jgi:nucleotide-binding universal stress UspA family protein
MRLVIALDGSPYGERAVAAVAARNLPPETKLMLMTVIDPGDIKQTARGYQHTLPMRATITGHPIPTNLPEPQFAESHGQAIERAQDEAEVYLRHVASELLPGREPDILVVFDEDIADAIVKAADNTDEDIIAMGTHGRTGVRHMILGSIAEKVIREATVPVVVVGPKAQDQAKK